MNRPLGLILAISIMLAGCMGGVEEDVFYGEDINPPVPVTDFILTDENGDYFSLSEYEGKVVVVTFLFTRCPDICPIVSANLDYLSDMLGDDYGTEVEILTITVDPWTDNSSVLHQYREQRGLHWPHLTGSVEDLEDIWLEFDVGLQTGMGYRMASIPAWRRPKERKLTITDAGWKLNNRKMKMSRSNIILWITGLITPRVP